MGAPALGSPSPGVASWPAQGGAGRLNSRASQRRKNRSLTGSQLDGPSGVSCPNPLALQKGKLRPGGGSHQLTLTQESVAEPGVGGPRCATSLCPVSRQEFHGAVGAPPPLGASPRSTVTMALIVCRSF